MIVSGCKARIRAGKDGSCGGSVNEPIGPAYGCKALEPILEEPQSIERSDPHEIVIPGEEEERRLFYVAATRAKQELYLVFPVMARDRMQMDILMEPSRFIRELPEGTYEKWIIGTE